MKAATRCAGWLCAAALALSPAWAQRTLVDKRAPDFAREDLAGNRVELSDYRGKVVLLNFWATWCAPCQLELPRFAAWQRKYAGDGLQVIAVSMDDDAGPVRSFARKMNFGFPVVMGDAELGARYGGVLGLPVTFLIERDGTVAAGVEGETDLGALESRIKMMLAEDGREERGARQH